MLNVVDSLHLPDLSTLPNLPVFGKATGVGGTPECAPLATGWCTPLPLLLKKKKKEHKRNKGWMVNREGEPSLSHHRQFQNIDKLEK